MDLSGSRFAPAVLAPPGFASLSMLLASAAGRQAATPTARLAARLAAGNGVGRNFGAFERETATMLRLMGQG
ncbi:hypothetical protein [Sphingomonas yantingensis]|jgi:uncharacterized protein YfiM (DUF2279 family)|uniref:Uncharacterized protein YfiM (DUF2279 family) n=2 Tax=Sphingomonas TaxID=13687 RepID=A0A7W9APS9_9SPHN|nr:hypothetical protein [Sphingomonas yantingensis]MBB5698156.1 uncharacterized protein YfiM (DUF2279 family) [Sphingomonas yantingensis]HCB76547.1 hypothetical protein [Sphingomonas bacterium]